jgi:hypothetical protein
MDKSFQEIKQAVEIRRIMNSLNCQKSFMIGRDFLSKIFLTIELVLVETCLMKRSSRSLLLITAHQTTHWFFDQDTL